MSKQPSNHGPPRGRERTPDGRFAKAHPSLKLAGRPKGSTNLITRNVRADIIAAYTKRGGVEWLARLDDALFVRLLEKALPPALPEGLAGADGQVGTVDMVIPRQMTLALAQAAREPFHPSLPAVACVAKPHATGPDPEPEGTGQSWASRAGIPCTFGLPNSTSR